ncbi:MAG: hypothetical protein KH452_13635 [Clostridiales bacterium]|nr:hypothetical protein [Clostridiales bacterium]
MNGKVIAFEGIDGSGKGVQIAEIARRLKKLKNEVLVQDFPVYSSFFGREIGKMLSGEHSVRADIVDPKSMSLWYALDRYESLKNLNKMDYDYVLFNRSTLSSAVYQSIRIGEDKRDEFIQWLFELEFDKLGIWKPDLYFIFDVTEEQSKKNVAQKEQRSYLKSKYDVYEESQDIMNQARNVYLRQARRYDNIFIVPCMDDKGNFKSIDEIASYVMEKILNSYV